MSEITRSQTDDPTTTAGEEREKPAGALKLFRGLGVDVYLHWTWGLAAVLLIQWKTERYSSMLWPVLDYVALFAIVLLHEYGHALACRSVGGRADRIMLWPLGGVAYVQPPLRAWPYLWSIFAGPLVNIVLLPVFWFASSAIASGQWAVSADVEEFFWTLNWVNISLLIFNLLPVFPLDGGQLLRGLIWTVAGPWRSLTIASALGVVGAIGLAVAMFVFLRPSVWLLVMLAFLLMQSVQGFKQGRALTAAYQIPRRAGAKCPHCGEPPPASLLWQCAQCQQQYDVLGAPACPKCGRVEEAVPCWFCQKPSPQAAWSS